MQPPPYINDSFSAARIVRDVSDHNTILWNESAFILCLNNNNKLLGWYRIAIGGMDTVNLDIRVIATIALKCIATRVILAHNHPSGNVNPSKADIKITRQLKTVLNIIGIKLTDHVIFSAEEHFSMKDACLF